MLMWIDCLHLFNHLDCDVLNDDWVIACGTMNSLHDVTTESVVFIHTSVKYVFLGVLSAIVHTEITLKCG
jgi:hypothetical protein